MKKGTRKNPRHTARRDAVTRAVPVILLTALVATGAVGCGESEVADSHDEVSGTQTAGAADMSGMDMGGMDMSAASTEGSVRLTSDELSTFGITFGHAEVRRISRTIRAVGVVEFDEARMAYLAPKFGGWAEALHADFTGQPVRRGQALLEVYSPELITAQEDLLLAARMVSRVAESRVPSVVEGARDLLQSARRRLSYWDISEDQIERILAAGEVQRRLTLYAPVSGIVMEKNVVEGQAFAAGFNLYMIADLSRVWINAEVFEVDAALVTEGMPVQVAIAALPGGAFEGSVEFVYPTLEPATRSLRARVSMSNPRGVLKPGMYATVTVSVDLDAMLTVPETAVLHTGERTVAFVDMGGGELMPHELTLGVQGEGYVQVLDGIEPGQRVVTSAQFLLDSESNLSEVMRAMMAQMNVTDMEEMEGMDMDGMDMDGTDMDGMGPMNPDTTGAR